MIKIFVVLLSILTLSGCSNAGPIDLYGSIFGYKVDGTFLSSRYEEPLTAREKELKMLVDAGKMSIDTALETHARENKKSAK